MNYFPPNRAFAPSALLALPSDGDGGVGGVKNDHPIN